MPDVTRLLDAAAAGDRKAASELLPLVYDELRRLASARMAHETAGNTLTATALVHEAYLRLLGPAGDRQFVDRHHLFAAAAEVIRHILVDRARSKGRLKHGGGRQRLDLKRLAGVYDLPPDDLLDLSDALDCLATEDPAKAEFVKLRYFGGLSVEEAAAALGISRATADRHWAYARAWLQDRLFAE
jgi:RNA polymerase sigma factor (TIGR02999 family)